MNEYVPGIGIKVSFVPLLLFFIFLFFRHFYFCIEFFFFSHTLTLTVLLRMGSLLFLLVEILLWSFGIRAVKDLVAGLVSVLVWVWLDDLFCFFVENLVMHGLTELQLAKVT